MTKEDRNRADARFNKAKLAKPGRTDRDAATKAVLDNMAKLKALRLAREAAEPPPPAAVKKSAQIKEETGRESAGTGGLAGGPAKRRTPDLILGWLSRRGPRHHRSRLGRGVVDLHLKHLELILQRHAGLLGGFDGVVVRLEMAVHHQRVAVGRRLVGANDFARLCSSVSIFGFFILAPGS